ETYIFIPCVMCGDKMEYSLNYIAKRMRIYKQFLFFCSIPCSRKSRRGRPLCWTYQEEQRKLLLDTNKIINDTSN
ncbi:MAG: hypothetical protein AABY22_11975, partial [Nanoarchaeota archaeon]